MSGFPLLYNILMWRYPEHKVLWFWSGLSTEWQYIYLLYYFSATTCGYFQSAALCTSPSYDKVPVGLVANWRSNSITKWRRYFDYWGHKYPLKSSTTTESLGWIFYKKKIRPRLQNGFIRTSECALHNTSNQIQLFLGILCLIISSKRISTVFTLLNDNVRKYEDVKKVGKSIPLF